MLETFIQNECTLCTVKICGNFSWYGRSGHKNSIYTHCFLRFWESFLYLLKPLGQEPNTNLGNQQVFKIITKLFSKIYEQLGSPFFRNVSISFGTLYFSEVCDWSLSKFFLEIMERSPESWIITTLHWLFLNHFCYIGKFFCIFYNVERVFKEKATFFL